MTPDRVVHLVDPSAPDGGPCAMWLAAESIRAVPEATHAVVVIGSGADVRLARECGLHPRGHVIATRGLRMAASRGLRRTIAGLRRSVLVHAWSARAGLLAAVAAARHRRLATLTLPPFAETGRAGPRSIDAARMLASGTTVLCTSSTAREGCAAIGLAAASIDVPAPRIGGAIRSGCTRECLRGSWRAGDAFMVGLLVEPRTWSDIRAAAAVTARAAATGRNVRLVAHPSGAGRYEAIRWLRSLDRTEELVLDERADTPWGVLPGLDAVLHVSDERPARVRGGRRAEAGALALRWALASGVPVLADDTRPVREIVRDGENGLIADGHDVNASSRALLRIIDEPESRQRMTAAGKRSAGTSETAFAERIRDAYGR